LKVPSRIQNQLSVLRRSRGISASDLAQSAGVSRQTIYAIEAGSFIPNTEVSLLLAQTLEVRVEEIFSLTQDKPKPNDQIQTESLSTQKPVKGQAVRLGHVGDRLVSIPVHATPYFLPEADGVISKLGRNLASTWLTVFAKDEALQKNLVLAGCDPAIGLISGIVAKLSGVELISAPASSRLALQWLKEGKVHIAGSHLEDQATGEFNIPFVRHQFPDGDFTVVNFARWEEGWLTAPANPSGIEDATSLTRRGIRFINREPGSGSRALLDQQLNKCKIKSDKIRGYDSIAFGHLAAAYAVSSGQADACLATRSAAQAFGLHFIPLQSERYDFVIRKSSLDIPAVQTFLDILQRASLRRKLEVLAGYDTSQTGSTLA